MCWTWNSDFPGSSSVQLLCWSNRVKTQRHCCDFFRSKVHLPPSEGQKALTPTAKDPFSRTACKCCVDQRLRGNRTVHSLISFHFLTCVKSFVCSHNCYDWSLSKNQDVCGSSECYWSLQHNDNLFWALLVSVSVVKLRSHHRQKGRQESGFLVRYGLTQVQTVIVWNVIHVYVDKVRCHVMPFVISTCVCIQGKEAVFLDVFSHTCSVRFVFLI